MESTRKPKEHLNCVKCGKPIPDSLRSDAKYCTQSCRAAAEKKRYKETHPEYVERQKKLVNRIKHLKEYGHTEFIERPELNTKDKFALARSLGYRSMLEYNVAQQLIKAGVPFVYEGLKITYFKSEDDVFDEEDQLDGNEKRWW
jgi:predicted nucleic acid-binding Zn ribbon protein